MQRKTLHWRLWITIAATFLSLLFLWPNFVHEPLHLFALRMQSSDGYISFDWHIPAHPSTTRTASVSGVWGGLLFLLLPSIASLLILAMLWFSRAKGNIYLHGVLATYLTFDLIINILHYDAAISDFRFLQGIPNAAYINLLIVIALLLWIAALLYSTLLENGFEQPTR